MDEILGVALDALFEVLPLWASLLLVIALGMGTLILVGVLLWA